MSIGIIYDTKTRVVRRVVIADDLDGHVGIGESLILADESILIPFDGTMLPDIDAVKALVARG